jgi:hypothetical protein
LHDFQTSGHERTILDFFQFFESVFRLRFEILDDWRKYAHQVQLKTYYPGTRLCRSLRLWDRRLLTAFLQVLRSQSLSVEYASLLRA